MTLPHTLSLCWQGLDCCTSVPSSEPPLHKSLGRGMPQSRVTNHHVSVHLHECRRQCMQCGAKVCTTKCSLILYSDTVSPQLPSPHFSIMVALPGQHWGLLGVVQFLVITLIPPPQVWEHCPGDQADQPPLPVER